MANSKDNISKYATSFIGFDELVGNAYDNLGGYIGTVYNNPTRVTGWNGEGYAMSFNGSNSYVLMNSPVIPLGDKTIRFKFKKNTTAVADNDVIFCTSGTTDTSHNGFYLTMVNNDFGFYVVHNGVAKQYATNNPITDTNWHDFTLTVDGNTLKIYLDGVLTSQYDDYVETFTTQKHNLYIGSYQILGSFNFNGCIDSLEMYDRAISITPDKYLVFHNNEYKYHDGTSWQVTTATEENFIQYGMNQLSQITEAQWQELSGDISIVMWSDFEDKQYMNVVLERDSFTAKDVIGDEYDIVVLNSEQVNPQKLLLDAVANPQTIYPTGDIQLFGIKELKSVNVTATGNGRIGISVDSGVTWNKLNGDTWGVITDIADGMTFTEFNALTGEQLEVLKGDNNTIRFAYYLSNDTEVDRIELRISMSGTPQFANKNDYDMSYDASTKTITYDIKKSGDYVVNYINA